MYRYVEEEEEEENGGLAVQRSPSRRLLPCPSLSLCSPTAHFLRPLISEVVFLT